MKVDFSGTPKVSAASLDAFTGLKNLELDFELYENRYWKIVSRLLRQNPGLLSLKMRSHENGETTPQFLARLSKCCPNLKALHISSATLDLKDLEQFLATCNQLEVLVMEPVEIWDSSYNSNPFSHPENVKLTLPRQISSITKLRILANISLVQQLEIIKRCPGLTSMAVMLPNTGQTALPENHLHEILRKCCPLINDIDLERCLLTDTGFTKVIDECRSRLARAYFFASDFGPQALQSLLGQHATSLTSIKVTECKELKSSMNLQILTSFPNLREFRGTVLKAQDIFGIPEGSSEDTNATTDQESTLIQPKEWVCKNLRIFNVFICGLYRKPTQWHRVIMQQLAKFEKLEELDISPSASEIYRCRTSMGQLSKLRMNMEEEDVRWMLKAWPELERVRGDMDHNSSKETALSKILKDNGVEADFKFFYD
ncbi:hypothetical protein BGX26_005723 [Mortierella sp. AD094]|nr:hypothetical protein BGX26_005723 [Mortierella sp. AD094]